MSYNRLDGELLLFGGDDGTTLLKDTWEYDGTAWTHVATESKPQERVGQGMATTHGIAFVFGGFGGLSVRNDLYHYTKYRGHRWMFFPRTGPSAREDMSLANTRSMGLVLLFGGTDGSGYFSDTWEFCATPCKP
jgi:hypothetical protein